MITTGHVMTSERFPRRSMGLNISTRSASSELPADFALDWVSLLEESSPALRIYLRSANRWYLRNQMSPQASLSILR